MKSMVASPSHEREVGTLGGALMLVVLLLLASSAAGVWVHNLRLTAVGQGTPGLFFLGLALVALVIVGLFGFFTLEPNQARVLVLFGNYRGTVRQAGFHWANPFYQN